ncbi:MAG: hypothetical protein WB783_01525 [Arenicellales bacterium]
MPLPFSRFAECPACRTELHVCRMCRHYNPRYVGQCDHDFADKVLIKDKSNFCSHFRPSPGAFEGSLDGGKQKAQQELQSLFGSGPGSSDPAAEAGEPRSEAQAAKKKLDDLFGK